ncbi:DUF2963 domain-containing protein, partial [Candidatus Phytoplasma pruni]|nr:hypothetical protein [Candidatus Phytoplasma pruni]
MTNNHKHHAPAERTTPNNKTTTHIDSLGFKTITEYNANKRKIKETWYRSDGSPYYIKEFNPITKKRTKYTEYKNGTLYYIAYHHPQSDNFTIPTYYWSDNTLNHIKDY